MRRHRWPPEGTEADKANICIVCGVRRRFVTPPATRELQKLYPQGAPAGEMVVEYLYPGVGWTTQRPECDVPGQLQLLDPDPREGLLP